MEKNCRNNPYAVTHDVELTHELHKEDEEAGFHQSVVLCTKNPGHEGFIPMNEFSLHHLPKECRNDYILEYVRAIGDRTVRMKVSCTSASRPLTFPYTKMGSELPYYQPGGPYPWGNKAQKPCTRVGSGFVTFIHKGGEWEKKLPVPKFLKEKDFEDLCPCSKNCQEKNWAIFQAVTARHLVFNQEEADNLEVEFFFNTDQDRTEGKTRIIHGAKVSDTSLEGDRCRLYLYTHDTSLIERMEKGGQSFFSNHELEQNEGRMVFPVFVWGHPHGRGKVVTVGEVTEHKMDSDPDETFDPVSTFTAPTCSGSSGGPVVWYRYEVDDGKTRLVSLPRPHCGSLKKCSEDGKKLGRCGQLYL